MTATLDRRLHPLRPDLAARELAGRVDAACFADPVEMEVVAPIAPLRREPRPDAPLDTEALAGERVRVYESEEGWAWSQLVRDGYVGYLPDDALRPPGPSATHRVSALRTYVYPGASMKLPPLRALPLGAHVAVAGAAGEFAVLADGGHVFAGHLATHDSVEPDFVAVAECFLHAPYLWGGKSSLGIDCSGLVQLSLAAAGRHAPRDTDMIENGFGTTLPVTDALEGLQRGDLIFWKGHVGILTDPDTLLHATAYSMQVMREPLREARDRILARSFGPITSIRRP